MIPGILDELLGVRLFGYISFRMAMAALTAFAFALWWGRPVIAWLRRHRVREDVTKTDEHRLARLAVEMGKAETTTMGGSFLVASLVASVLLWARLDNVHVVFGVLLVAGLAAVGFVDDFKKLTLPKSPGLSRRAKMVGLSVVTLACLGALVYYARASGRDTLLELYPPLFKDAVIALPALGVLGILLFLAFEWVVVVGSANAANITDGLDGLAAGCMIISGLALAIFCYVSGRPDWTGYLGVPHVVAASEMAVVGGALVGACLGFLWYNAFPAQVFMGDTGSMGLGGAIAAFAIMTKTESLLIFIGGIFVIEALSVIVQVVSFKWFGRRVLLMAPLHHHFEMKAWSETRIMVRFWIVTAILCACGFVLYYRYASEFAS
jgi:phospho-N-acetylmuramoyl-pentapeptide-transferase